MEIHGYAIVSADDRIADPDGRLPAVLTNAADWAYFQAQLDLADLVVLGHASHLATPNEKRRRRLVVTRKVASLENRDEAWWWNPKGLPWDEAAARLVGPEARIAVPGGRDVFDLFLGIGYDAFHLSRVESVVLPGGRELFSAIGWGRSADDLLRGQGLLPEPRRVLDETARVSVTIYRPGT